MKWLKNWWCRQFHEKDFYWVNYRPTDWDQTIPYGPHKAWNVRLETWDKKHAILDLDYIYCPKCKEIVFQQKTPA